MFTGVLPETNEILTNTTTIIQYFSNCALFWMFFPNILVNWGKQTVLICLPQSMEISFLCKPWRAALYRLGYIAQMSVTMFGLVEGIMWITYAMVTLVHKLNSKQTSVSHIYQKNEIILKQCHCWYFTFQEI